MSAGPLVPRVQAPARTRKPVAAVACAPDPLAGRAAPPSWLVDGLLAQGLLVVTLEQSTPAMQGVEHREPPASMGSLTLWDLVGGVEDALDAAATAPGVDSTRVGLLGVHGGAPLALVGGSRAAATRVALLMPWSPEIAARRIERAAGGNPREALVKALAELQPLRTFADAPAKPTLLLHSAADRNGGPEHALSIAMGLHLDGRHIERLALAFSAPEALESDESIDELSRASVIAALSHFFTRSAA